VLEAIRIHNRLNGLVFSLVEFLAASLVVVPIAMADLRHGMAFLVPVGWIANCLTIALIAGRSLRRREEDVGGIGSLRIARDPELRRRVAAEHPNLSRHTLFLVVGIMVPFSVFGLAALDGQWARHRRADCAVRLE